MVVNAGYLNIINDKFLESQGLRAIVQANGCLHEKEPDESNLSR